MLRKMTTKDIDQITRIHMSSWSQDDFLTKLGQQFLQKCFYKRIVESDNAFGYIYCEGNKILGYASGFTDYPTFRLNIMRSPLSLVLAFWQLLIFRLSWEDILSALTDSQKSRHIKNPKYQFGAIALRREYKGTVARRKIVRKIFQAVLDEFVKRNAPSVWGVTSKNNVPMARYFEKFGFDLVDEIKTLNRTVVVFEKTYY